MIRQAHTYLAGAVSGTALIGAAVVAFVVLVSLQALRDWPLAGIGGSDNTAVSSGHATGAGVAPTATAGAAVAPGAGPGATARRHGGGRHPQAVNASPGSAVSPPPGAPAGQGPASSPGTEGGSGGSAPQPTASGSGGNGGGGGTGGGGGRPPEAGGTGGGGGSTSKALTGAVNETVSGVDKALGGTLGDVGATKATEEVVAGVAGPESTVGKTVDEAVEAVGGLLGGHR